MLYDAGSVGLLTGTVSFGEHGNIEHDTVTMCQNKGAVPRPNVLTWSNIHSQNPPENPFKLIYALKI